jgi:hypothetical protein
MISVYVGHHNAERQGDRSELLTEIEFNPTIPFVGAFSHGDIMTGKRTGTIILAMWCKLPVSKVARVFNGRCWQDDSIAIFQLKSFINS